MKISLKEIIKLITPPVFIHIIKTLRKRGKSCMEWEYVPEGWVYSKKHSEIKGWNVAEILATYKKKWPKFIKMIQGTGTLGVSHESDMNTNEDIHSHNEIMSFAYILALASRNKNRISMLDWGGGIGHYYLLAQALLPELKIEYHCKDVPLLSEYGAQLFPQQHFYSDEHCFDRDYELVLASTSMHYTQNWQSLLRHLADVTKGYLYIAKIPVVQKASSFVFVQRTYKYGYNTEYLGWCLNRDELLRIAESAGLQLIREFVYGYQPFIYGAPEQNIYSGYLFQTSLKEK